jgi:hypothetical protein
MDSFDRVHRASPDPVAPTQPLADLRHVPLGELRVTEGTALRLMVNRTALSEPGRLVTVASFNSAI